MAVSFFSFSAKYYLKNRAKPENESESHFQQNPLTRSAYFLGKSYAF